MTLESWSSFTKTFELRSVVNAVCAFINRTVFEVTLPLSVTACKVPIAEPKFIFDKPPPSPINIPGDCKTISKVATLPFSKTFCRLDVVSPPPEP